MRALARLRPFYGWWVALALSTVILFAHGIGFYAMAALTKPLVEEFGWGRAAASGFATIYGLTRGLASPGYGRLTQRRGPRWVMLASAPLFGTALLLLSSIHSLWQLYAIYKTVPRSWCEVAPTGSGESSWSSASQGTGIPDLPKFFPTRARSRRSTPPSPLRSAAAPRGASVPRAWATLSRSRRPMLPSPSTSPA